MPKRPIDDALWPGSSRCCRTAPPPISRNMGRPRGVRSRGVDRDPLCPTHWNSPGECCPKEMGCGSGSTCWRRLVAGSGRRLATAPCAPARRIAPARPARSGPSHRRQRLGPGAARGKKLDRTQPIAVRRGRNTTFSPRRRHSPGRHCDRRQPPRRHPIDALAGRYSAAARRPATPCANPLIQGDRGYDSHPIATRSIAAASQQLAKRRSAAWQRTRPHAVGRRTHVGLALSFSSSQCPL